MAACSAEMGFRRQTFRDLKVINFSIKDYMMGTFGRDWGLADNPIGIILILQGIMSWLWFYEGVHFRRWIEYIDLLLFCTQSSPTTLWFSVSDNKSWLNNGRALLRTHFHKLRDFSADPMKNSVAANYIPWFGCTGDLELMTRLCDLQECFYW